MLLSFTVNVFAQTTSYNANTVPVGGNYCTAFGISALHINIGDNNSATGYGSLYSNTSGSFNTATGNVALNSNTTGSYNTAIGMSALNTNTTGSLNMASGRPGRQKLYTFFVSSLYLRLIRIGNSTLLVRQMKY